MGCPFCKSELRSIELADKWNVDNNEIIQIHEKTKIGYKELHDLEDYYLNLLIDTQSSEVYVDYCACCGWWRLIKRFQICAEKWQIWEMFWGCSGNLKNLSLNNISTPLEEVRQFLVAKYDYRYSLNPRLFEETVSSVFKNMGYDSHVTGYTNDGGIDIVLGNARSELIGVQVKRYKNKIKVEQIRSFAGALMLGDYVKGIFVTTSEYQPGATNAAEKFSTKNLPIELIDARRFYEALKITQKKTFDTKKLCNYIEDKVDSIFDYGCDSPMNSL
jgi:restriction system protein